MEFVTFVILFFGVGVKVINPFNLGKFFGIFFTIIGLVFLGKIYKADLPNKIFKFIKGET